MEKQKVYNLRSLFAEVRTTWEKASDRLRQRANKRNKNRVGRTRKSYCRTRSDVGLERVKDHDVEVVRSFKYLGTVINDTNDTTDKLKAGILAANKAYSSLKTEFRSKQMNWNNTIRLYETFKSLLCNGSVTSTLTQKTEQMLCTYECKILRRICGPIQDKVRGRHRWKSEIYNLY
jgi:hypothetical protein